MAAAGTDDVENRDRTTHNDSSGGLGVVVAILVAIVIAGRPARAEDGWNPPHVRPETAATQELVAVAITRSPTIRAMLERIERSDVVVYIRHRQFADSTLDGHIGVLSSVAGRRYLVIEIACGRNWIEQIATLGHELHHALEIADHQSIVDSRTLAAFYEQFGVRTGGFGPGGTFETAGARQTGQLVRRETFMKAVRTTEDK
jgi:hypothetical protein